MGGGDYQTRCVTCSIPMEVVIYIIKKDTFKSITITNKVYDCTNLVI